MIQLTFVVGVDESSLLRFVRRQETANLLQVSGVNIFYGTSDVGQDIVVSNVSTSAVVAVGVVTADDIEGVVQSGLERVCCCWFGRPFDTFSRDTPIHFWLFRKLGLSWNGPDSTFAESCQNRTNRFSNSGRSSPCLTLSGRFGGRNTLEGNEVFCF